MSKKPSKNAKVEDTVSEHVAESPAVETVAETSAFAAEPEAVAEPEAAHEEPTSEEAVVETVSGKYAKYLVQLSAEQLDSTWQILAEGGLVESRGEGQGAQALATALEDVSYIDVVMVLSPSADEKIVKIFMSEGLVAPVGDRQSSSHTRPNGSSSKKEGGAKKEKTEARKVDKAELADNRVFSVVRANPKKPSAAAHARYEHYRVGITVQEFIKAGGTMADVKWDLGRGFIELVSAEEWAAKNTQSNAA